MSAADGTRDPYVGPRPFDRSNCDLFFGRDREAHELLSLIYGHPAVLLYARSGVGKTSLVNAGLIPLLEPDARVFANVRVSGDLPKSLAATGVRCIFSLYARMSLEPTNPDVARMNREGMMPALSDLRDTRTERHDEDGIRVVFFDQFEELFTTSIDRWRDRDVFFDEVRAALQQQSRLRVVFAMREEYVARMDLHARSLPGRLEARYRLDGLRRASARDALCGPLRQVGRSLDTRVADHLVTHLLRQRRIDDPGAEAFEGEYVEPLHIQLVGSQIWSKLKTHHENLGAQAADVLVDLETALREHYDRSVREVSASSAMVSGTHVAEARIRAWFDQKLITPNNMRSMVLREAPASSGLPASIVKRLEDEHHLLRSEARGGMYWIELAHDRLVIPVRESNQTWLAAHEGGVLVDGSLEARAVAWIRSDRPETHLLSEGELVEIDRLLSSPIAVAFGVSDAVTEFRRASVVARDQRRHRVRRRHELLGALAIGIVLVGVLVVDQWREAVRREKEAVRLEKAESERVRLESESLQLGDELRAQERGKAEVEQQMAMLRGNQAEDPNTGNPALTNQLKALEARYAKLQADEHALDAKKNELLHEIAIRTPELLPADAENVAKLETRLGQAETTIDDLSQKLRRCELHR